MNIRHQPVRYWQELYRIWTGLPLLAAARLVKGLVQQQFPFGDGTAINLTVARYYTPSGRSIQKSYKNGVTSYRNELANRVRKGELLTAGSNLSDSAFLGASTLPYHQRP
jgi:hypothetical protein